MNVDALAKELYETYCQSVGGVAFNGDPLPSWDDFSTDPTKQKQTIGWKSVAGRAVILLVGPQATTS